MTNMASPYFRHPNLARRRMSLVSRRARRSWVVRPSNLGTDQHGEHDLWDDNAYWRGKYNEFTRGAMYIQAIEGAMLGRWSDTFWLQSDSATTEHLDRVWLHIDRLAQYDGITVLDSATQYADYFLYKNINRSKVKRYFGL